MHSVPPAPAGASHFHRVEISVGVVFSKLLLQKSNNKGKEEEKAGEREREKLVTEDWKFRE